MEARGDFRHAIASGEAGILVTKLRNLFCHGLSVTPQREGHCPSLGAPSLWFRAEAQHQRWLCAAILHFQEGKGLV